MLYFHFSDNRNIAGFSSAELSIAPQERILAAFPWTEAGFINPPVFQICPLVEVEIFLPVLPVKLTQAAAVNCLIMPN